MPAPVLVRLKAPLTTPLRVRVPAWDPRVESAVIVTAPDSELVPDRLSMAPMPPAPLPAIDTASAPTAALWNCNVPPLDTVVPAAVVPRAVLLATPRMPAPTEVVPV